MTENMNKDKDGAVNTTTTVILQTRDYTIFKKLPGNRPPDDAHVRRLIRNMLEVGNLTSDFPIVVNENMEVIDGQHRLEALKELGWPIAYRVAVGLTLDTVRGINQASQNWSWKDYAQSFAENGSEKSKDEYKRFLTLADYFGYPYHVLMHYCGLSTDNRPVNATDFRNGELKIPNFDRTFRLLEQYKAVSEAFNFHNSKLAIALYKIMQHPEYSQDRMVHKAKVYDLEIRRLSTLDDYIRFAEDVYNRNQTPDTKVRLY